MGPVWKGFSVRTDSAIQLILSRFRPLLQYQILAFAEGQPFFGSRKTILRGDFAATLTNKQ